MSSVERFATAVVLAGLVAWPGLALSQRISGRVTSALTGQRVPGARVFLEQAGVRVGAAVSDSSGSFAITARLAQGSDAVLRVLRLGYRVASRTFTVDSATDRSLDIALESAAIELPEIAVEAQRTERRLRRAGFYDRKEGGFGHFVTEEQIRAKNARLVTDALRGIPGLRIVPSTRLGVFEIQLTRTPGRLSTGACQPRIFLDGIVAGVDVDDYLTPEVIAAIEIYRGPSETPAQYGGAESDCGVILIWTK